METNLEQLIEKSTKTRESISHILTKNFPVEKDFADFLAMDIVNQAIGVDALERYNEAKLKDKKRKEDEEAERIRKRDRADRIWKLKYYAKNTGKYVLPSVVGLCLAVWAVTGVYSCATASPYPRTYLPLPEQVRFEDVAKGYKDKSVVGLSDDSNLCIQNYNYSRGTQPIRQAPACVHPNRLVSLNQALQKAVDEDFNGVVWNEPNGNGEIWTIVRNNYRFIITATKDENFIDR